MVDNDTIAAPVAAESNAVAESVPRVLIVDDEETVLTSIQGVLELERYQVVATTSGVEALDLTATQCFDVVLTDLRLEEVDGLHILRELHQTAPDTVPIVLTGYASLDTAVMALREGAYDYLVKPCDVLELRTTVARAVEHSRLAVQLRRHVEDLDRANDMIRALNMQLEHRIEQATARAFPRLTCRISSSTSTVGPMSRGASPAPASDCPGRGGSWSSTVARSWSRARSARAPL